MGTANSFCTWPRKWPTASPAIGLVRLSPLPSELKGKAAHTRCAAPFLSGAHLFSKFSFSGYPSLRSPCSLPRPLEALFPLDRAWGFGADIVYHPRHTGHFVDDAGRDAF